MTAELSPDLKKYLDESKVYAVVATTGSNGQPHLAPFWLTRDGDDILLSTTVARQHAKNIARDPRVTILVNPPENPFVYAEIRGTATVSADPERLLPDELSRKYTGLPYSEFNPASVHDADRVIVRVTPHKVVGSL
ncbi:PPOX class F420-dependent oxidoreductase [Nocardia sp. NPDC051832]|uniref:PPOX class F420-dependent oxidoreductase n=1 Tax=Nocardia sp. NPDC051832 TaxID=3155673 RepID=UPI00341B230C